MFKTTAGYYGHLKEPLPMFLSMFHLFDVFLGILGFIQKYKMGFEIFQTCCRLLPPKHKSKLHLLMRMMTNISLNKEMPPMCDRFGTQTLTVQIVSISVLCSKGEATLMSH